MIEVKRRLRIFLVLLISVALIGTLGFMIIEKLSFVDALYFNIVTMATVGYGDIHPTHQVTRLLALFIIIFGGGAFIGFIANATELMLLRRDAKQRMKKQNIVLGIFFSEIGYRLLKLFSARDMNKDIFSDLKRIDMNFSVTQLSTLIKSLGHYTGKLDIERLDLEKLNQFLSGKHHFILNLLENPVAVEHEGFTELLLAVAHLNEELRSRDNLDMLPKADLHHLAVDMNRAYSLLIGEWLVYLIHLKKNYLYMYSLAARKNPFNPDASTVIKDV
jgi:voltage-gated potassium channel